MDRRSSAEINVEVDVQVAPAFAGALSPEPLQKTAEAVLRREGRSGQVAVVVTDDEGILELNRDFLGLDEPTDVLAFSAKEEGGLFITAPEAEAYLGDIILSYPRAVAQAAELGHPLELELKLLVVHGLLHLLGYDHAGEDEKVVMWARQQELLQAL